MPVRHENNFDLLRLIAAAQVAFFHTIGHLGVPIDRANPLVVFGASLSGVPIFFVISGYLISASWEHSPRLASYSRNRALRIYPALWACLVVSVASASLLGGVSFLRSEAVPWLLAQLSIGQFYNPDFLRGYGVGVLNGSLWTIPVELQFYAFVPLAYRFLRLHERSGNLALAMLAAISIAAQCVLVVLLKNYPDSLPVKLFQVSLAPYLWMFLAGTLIQRNFSRIAPWLQGKGLAWIALYGAAAFAAEPLGIVAGSNHPNPLPMAILACATISCAHTAPWLSERLLRGTDISYGAYIYHMVVVNAVLALGLRGNWSTFAGASLATLGLALASWFAVERPALRRKKNSLHAVARSAVDQ